MMLQATIDLAGPVAHTMVGWLGTYLVHSSVLIGGVWAFTRCFTLDALTRSFLWKVSLVGGLFTASFQTGLGHEPWLGSLAIAGDTAPAPLPPMPPPPPPLPEMLPCDDCGGDLVVIVDSHDGTTVVAMPGFAGFDVPASPPAFATTADRDFPVYLTGAPVLGLPAPETVGPAVAAPPAHASPNDRTTLLALAGLFLTGAAVSLTRLGLTARRLRRSLRGRYDVMEGPLRERFDRLMERARISLRQVRLTMSHMLGSPLALASGEIVVPERAEELKPHQQEAMLAHELAHVVRRDPAWQILASAIEAALWFQPLHRVARRGMQEAAEELSDDWAVRHTGSGVHLARCLAEVATWPAPEDRSFASPMAAGGKLLVRRVQRLLDARERDRGLWARRWRGLLGAGLLAVVGLAAPGVSFAADDPAVVPVVLPDVPDVPPLPALARVPDVDHGPRLAFAGGNHELPMLALADAPCEHDRRVVVLESPNKLTARQRRLLRRAERLDRRADKLRDRSGARELPMTIEIDDDAIRIHHPHHVVLPPPPPPPRAPLSPQPPAPPRHVRVIHPPIPDIDTEAIEAAAEATAEATAEAAEAFAEAEIARALSSERVRHLQEQARALAEQYKNGAFANLDDEIKREIDTAMRDMERELRDARQELKRELRRGPSPDELRDLAKEAERAAEALRAIDDDADDEDIEDTIDHEALRQLLEDARRTGKPVRALDKNELRRIKDIARAAKAREKARRDLEKQKSKQK